MKNTSPAAALAWCATAWWRVLAAWLFFVAETYMSRWDFIPSRVGLIAAWLSLLAAPATLFGLLRLRTWSLITLIFLSALTSTEIFACRSEALARGYVNELGILAGLARPRLRRCAPDRRRRRHGAIPQGGRPAAQDVALNRDAE